MFKESHAENIAVHWPDGHVTLGLKQHIEDLKAMFAYAPDTRIQEYPVRIANGEWTSVIGVMEEEYLFRDNQTFMKQIGLAP